MFRRGGSAKNTGIVSGFENGGQVRKYYHSGGTSHNEQYGAGHESHEFNPIDPATDPEILRLQEEALPDITGMREEYLGEEPKRGPGLSVADWLRIAGAGFEMMGTPNTGGSGLKGYLAAASPSLSKLGSDLATSVGQRDAMYQQRLSDWEKANYEAGKEEELARAGFVQSELENRRADISAANQVSAELALQDLVGEQEMAQLVYEIQNKKFEFSEMLQARVDLAAKEAALIQRMEEGYKLTADGKSIEDELAVIKDQVGMLLAGTPGQEALSEAIGNIPKDLYERWYQDAKNAANQQGLDPETNEYWEMIEEMTARSAEAFISSLISAVEGAFKTEFAEGGRVGYANGGGAGMPMVDPNTTQQNTMTAPPTQDASALTFQELRRRLPPEVSDKVITLIVSSEEALMDFAQIQTPEDVARFNQKYNSDLVIPVEVA